MTTFDEQTNNDLPGEIHEWTEDPADRQYHDQTFPCERGYYRALSKVLFDCLCDHLHRPVRFDD